ncbi:hypothetical protein AYO38_04520 [bacterium SCGC AG-212-C10]|nr:hypothetical protein AYO38_04520 [bacterium SCGC AG-212-C10]
MPRVPGAYLESRRSGILDAASRVFIRKGFASATMAEIAAEAGITPGAIYRYFESKEALAESCFAPNAQAVQQKWGAPIPEDASPLDDLMSLASATVKLLDEPAEGASTMLFLEHLLDAVRDGNGDALAKLREERAHSILHVRSRVAAALEAGELPASLNAGALAEALVSFYFGARLERLLFPAADTSAQFDEIGKLIAFARQA